MTIKTDFEKDAAKPMPAVLRWTIGITLTYIAAIVAIGYTLALAKELGWIEVPDLSTFPFPPGALLI